jgi:hypothetical protein
MESYDNLKDAITALKKQGYTVDFNLRENCLVCQEGKHRLSADQFEIDKSFRFDVDTDPADQSAIYAISSSDNTVKGILVNGYGVYSDPMSNEILRKLK